MSANMLIEVTYQDQCEIEDICTTQGKSLSQYFLELHRANLIKISRSEEIQEPEENTKQMRKRVRK